MHFKFKNPYNPLTTIAFLGVVVYLFLATLKFFAGSYFQSASIQADAFNNFTDIFGSASVLIGLFLANKPKDEYHHFGHMKFEALASFFTSVLMFSIGSEIVIDAIKTIYQGTYQQTQIQAVFISLISLLILVTFRHFINQKAKETNSLGLKTTAADMKNDIMISLGSIIGTVFAHYQLPLIDLIITMMVGVLILFSAYEIFKESSFTLSDGFDKDLLAAYKESILRHPQVMHVSNIRGRLSGNHIYLDVTIHVDDNLTVTQAHQITEEIEQILWYNYNVQDCDVHVEPCFLEIS